MAYIVLYTTASNLTKLSELFETTHCSSPMPLLKFTDKGIYCEQADIYIDPWHPVDKALITHAHADHSRWGHKFYLAHKDSEGVMRLRLGQDINLHTVEYREDIHINQVKFSFHPAGHIIGSAQIRV